MLHDTGAPTNAAFSSGPILSPSPKMSRLLPHPVDYDRVLYLPLLLWGPFLSVIILTPHCASFSPLLSSSPSRPSLLLLSVLLERKAQACQRSFVFQVLTHSLVLVSWCFISYFLALPALCAPSPVLSFGNVTPSSRQSTSLFHCGFTCDSALCF